MNAPPENGSRRAIDGVILAQLARIEQKLDGFEHRVTKLETRDTFRNRLTTAMGITLTAIAGAVAWLLKG